MRRRSLALLLAAPLAGALTACGFALRQPPRFAFKTIYLALPAGSTLGLPLQRALQYAPDLRVLTEARDMMGADVVLDVISEQREKVVAGLSAAGQVREFQLRLRLNFRLRTPQGKELIEPTELLLQRDSSFSESAALAKEEEEALLYRDMRNDMVQQIVRRLAAVPEL